MKLVALVDVDGVLCDFVSGYLSLVRKVGWPGSSEWSLADVTDWSFQKCLGLSNDCVRDVEQLLFEPGFVRSLSSLPGAYEGIALLERKGLEVVFLTSPWRGHPTWSHERAEWLNERWPGRSVISTNAKHHVNGTILVDDKPSHVESWLAAHPGMLGLLWDAPYNRASGLTRVLSWEQVVCEGPAHA